MAFRRRRSPRNISFAMFMNQSVSRCHKPLNDWTGVTHVNVMTGFVELLKVKRYEIAP